jgi:hypothetical protein
MGAHTIWPHEGQRRILIDPDGDGWTHIVTGSAVTSFTVTLTQPAWARRLCGKAVHVIAAADEALFLRPNDDGANCKNLFDQSIVGVGSTLGTEATRGLTVALSSGATTLRSDFSLDLSVSPQDLRHFMSHYSALDAVPTAIRVAQNAGQWRSTAPLTSVVFRGYNAGGLGVNTRVALWWDEL